MTTDVTWGYFEHVSRPAQWDTLLGRITYMMDIKGIETFADLARRSKVNTRQVPNQLKRLAKGADLKVQTVAKLARGLEVSPGWLGFNEGWPTEDVHRVVDGEVRTRSTPPPPAMEVDDHRSSPPDAPVHPIKRRPKSGNRRL